jgi:hypothetical protein
VFQNVFKFFNEFPNVFDTIIENCFPKLKPKIKFFNDFDTLIVVIEARDSYANCNLAPTIEYYYLRSDDTNPKEEIKFYLKGRDNIPINREMDFESKICVDGKSYTAVKFQGPGMLTFIFDRLPMYNYLYKTLGEKMNCFFHNTG